MSIHDRYAEQRIAAAEHDLVEAHKRIHKLEELVRDMWEFGFSCRSGADSPVEYAEREDGIRQRIRDLGLEVDA